MRLLTDKQRKFIDAVRSGLTGRAAAIEAGYSENGASVAACRLMENPKIQAALERHKKADQAKQEVLETGKSETLPELNKDLSDPIHFLTFVMTDPAEEMRHRMDAAKALMPYLHERKGASTSSRKQERENALQDAMERFSVPTPPPVMRQ